MKRVIILVAVTVFAVAGFSSCKKCTTCQWTYQGTVIVDYPQECESAKTIKDYKNTIGSAFSGPDYTFTCVDK